MKFKTPQVIVAIAIRTSFYHCNEPPDQPVKAECAFGYIPCADDSTVCCPDTVGHVFEWEVFRFGEPGGATNSWNDVTIDDHGAVWAVGKIFTDSINLEMAVYAGSEWELRDVQVPFQDHFTSPALFTINIVNDSTIWLQSDLPIKGNGVDWKLMDYRDSGLPDIIVGNACIYCVNPGSCIYAGYMGRILKIDNDQYEFLDSPIGMTITTLSVSNGKYFAAAWNNSGDYMGQSALIYSLNGEDWLIHKQSSTFYPGVNSSDPGLIPSTIAFDDTCYHATSYGIYRFEPISGYDEQWFNQWESKISGGTVYEMSGNTKNDFILYNGDKTIIHYDGYNWWNYRIEEIEGGFFFSSLCFKDDMAVISGTSTSTGEAVIVIGRR